MERKPPAFPLYQNSNDTNGLVCDLRARELMKEMTGEFACAWKKQVYANPDHDNESAGSQFPVRVDLDDMETFLQTSPLFGERVESFEAVRRPQGNGEWSLPINFAITIPDEQVYRECFRSLPAKLTLRFGFKYTQSYSTRGELQTEAYLRTGTYPIDITFLRGRLRDMRLFHIIHLARLVRDHTNARYPDIRGNHRNLLFLQLLRAFGKEDITNRPQRTPETLQELYKLVRAPSTNAFIVANLPIILQLFLGAWVTDAASSEFWRRLVDPPTHIADLRALVDHCSLALQTEPILGGDSLAFTSSLSSPMALSTSHRTESSNETNQSYKKSFKLGEFCYHMTRGHIHPISYASITRVERIRDVHSAVRHEYLALYASLGDIRMVIRIERARSDIPHSAGDDTLTWSPFDTFIIHMNCSELPPPVPAEFTVLAKEEKRQVVSQLSFLLLHGRRAPQVRDLGMILRVMSHICPMQVLYKESGWYFDGLVMGAIRSLFGGALDGSDIDYVHPQELQQFVNECIKVYDATRFDIRANDDRNALRCMNAQDAIQSSCPER